METQRHELTEMVLVIEHELAYLYELVSTEAMHGDQQTTPSFYYTKHDPDHSVSQRPCTEIEEPGWHKRRKMDAL